jgi:hypothetical protein
MSVGDGIISVFLLYSLTILTALIAAVRSVVGIKGGVVSGAETQTIPALCAGGDHAMTSNGTKLPVLGSDAEIAVGLLDEWFDLIVGRGEQNRPVNPFGWWPRLIAYV